MDAVVGARSAVPQLCDDPLSDLPRGRVGGHDLDDRQKFASRLRIPRDSTRKYWPITLWGYALHMVAVPLLALAERWEVAARQR